MIVQGQDTRAEFESRTIYIAETTAPSRRYEELLHELAHAWLFHVPPPRTEEELAQFLATVSEAARQDFDRQGGLSRLKAIQPRLRRGELRIVVDEWSQVG